MKRYCLTLLLLSCFLVSKSAAWEIKPWQAYLIEQKVKADTMAVPGSVMFPQKRGKKKLALHNFRIPCYYPVKQKTMFERWDEQEELDRIARGDYHTSDLIVDMLRDIIDIFLNK